jgi:hypothetical protein
MAEAQQKQIKFFVIRAQSIVFTTDGGGFLSMVLFKPDRDTLNRLRELRSGQDIGAVQLIDKWDNGTDDIHENFSNHKFVSISGSGDGRKTSAFTLMLDRD